MRYLDIDVDLKIPGEELQQSVLLFKAWRGQPHLISFNAVARHLCPEAYLHASTCIGQASFGAGDQICGERIRGMVAGWPISRTQTATPDVTVCRWLDPVDRCSS